MSDQPFVPGAPGSIIRPFLDGGAGSGPAGSPGEPPVAAAGTSVRPFLVTSGRTASAADLPVEMQVVATERGETLVDVLTFEYRDIVSLCLEPVAVAEIAARLSLHLGVIRVLVTDLQQQGMLATYSPAVDPVDDVEMIMRVIHGLRQRS